MNTLNDSGPMRSRREPFTGPVEAWVHLQANRGDADSITKSLVYELARQVDSAHLRIADLEEKLERMSAPTPPRPREQMAFIPEGV